MPALMLYGARIARGARATPDFAKDTVGYTDGGCRKAATGHGSETTAGWGAVVLTDDGEDAAVELHGPVCCEEQDWRHLGASRGTNNTAELTAIAELLLWARDHDHKKGAIYVYYDSKYAANAAQNGPTPEAKNLELATTVHGLYRQVSRTRRVELVHVYGHTGNRWNEHADMLATRGQGLTDDDPQCAAGRYAPGARRVPLPTPGAHGAAARMPAPDSANGLRTILRGAMVQAVVSVRKATMDPTRQPPTPSAAAAVAVAQACMRHAAERDFYAACGKARTYGPWSSKPLNDARQCTLPFAQPATKAEFGAKWAGVARVRNGERMEMLLR